MVPRKRSIGRRSDDALLSMTPSNASSGGSDASSIKSPVRRKRRGTDQQPAQDSEQQDEYLGATPPDSDADPENMLPYLGLPSTRIKPDELEYSAQDSAFLVSSPGYSDGYGPLQTPNRQWRPGQFDLLLLLPPEISFTILKHLQEPQQILKASRVCKAWYAMATDNVIWKSAFEGQVTWRIRPDAESYLEGRAADPEAKPFPYFLDEASPRKGWITRDSRGRANQSDGAEYWSELSVLLDSPGSAAGDLTSEYSYIVQNDRNGNSSVPSTPLGPRRQIKKALPAAETDAVSDQTQLGRVDWRKLYAAHHILDQRWRGKARGPDGKPFMPPYSYLVGHEDSIYCVANDESDGIGTSARLISGSRDHTIKIWDVEAKKCMGTFKGHTGSVLCVRLDGDRLYTGSSDGYMIVWDYAQIKASAGNSSEKGPLPIIKRLYHPWSVLDIDYNDAHLISCCRDGTVRVWDRNRFECILKYSSHNSPVNSGKLSGDKIVTIAGNNSVHIWNVITGKLERFFHTDQGPACVLFEEGLVIVGTKDPLLYAFNEDDGSISKIWRGHQELVRALAYDKRRKIIASGGYDGRVKLWKSDMDTAILTLQRHQDQVLDVAVGFARIISVGKEKSICIRNFGHGLDLSLFV